MTIASIETALFVVQEWDFFSPRKEAAQYVAKALIECEAQRHKLVESNIHLRTKLDNALKLVNIGTVAVNAVRKPK